MSAKVKKSDTIFLDLTTRMRKYLWGAHHNKQKILALLDLNKGHLQKSLDLKEKHAQYLDNLPSEEVATLEQLMQNSREIGWIKREIHKLDAIRSLLTKPDNPWPRIKLHEPDNLPEETPPRQQHPKTGENQEVTESTDEAPKKILIIEDESIIIKSISYFLLQEKYQVLFSLNADDGFKKTLENKPDLILLDIMMPGMNGYQFLSRLKKNPAVEYIPVIILSSLSRESDILEGLERGASDYITKPFSPKVLMSKIKKIMLAQHEHPPHPGNN